LMPYSAGAFLMFGLGSVPSGRLGDLWGRRQMMLVFFFGMGVSAILVALTTGPWQIAVALTVLGAFSSIYHPVGIPMLVQHALKPGFTIGVNGLAGNMGIALAAVVTGFIVKYLGWRAAFAIPGIVAIACGFLFARAAPHEAEPPAKRTTKVVALPQNLMLRVVVVMTLTAITGGLLFNFTTNGNGQLLRERFAGVIEDPAVLGMLLGFVYAIASFSQLIVGRLIDRYPLKRIYLAIVLAQIPLFALASVATGWSLFALQIAFMAVIFGAIPFTDAMVVRYVDDRMRSRVSGVRLAVSFGISSMAVWALGPAVKAAGFQTLLLVMAVIAACSALFVSMLPGDESIRSATAAKVPG
ncbi:MAG TPA: MFS transporter, partial [Quisquiliibacterium sp.]|nr:MFS transporter [Quisquiliibacterium sp.]